MHDITSVSYFKQYCQMVKEKREWEREVRKRELSRGIGRETEDIKGRSCELVKGQVLALYNWNSNINNYVTVFYSDSVKII